VTNNEIRKGEESPEEYFDRLERERASLAPKMVKRNPSLDEYKQRIANAAARYQQRMSGSDPDKENYLNKIPESHRDLARAFIYRFRLPLKKEDSYWRKAWIDQETLGISVGDVIAAMKRMEKDGLFIKSPESVTAIANNFMLQRVAKEVSSA